MKYNNTIKYLSGRFFEQNKSAVYFIPLGGSNEIGMNLNLYHQNGEWLMVDCGVGFCNAEYPGVTLMVPDISFIKENKIKIDGLVLTHIHEDHVGAIHHLWDQIGKPMIWSTGLGASFLRHKFAETRHNPDITVISGNQPFLIGSFEIEPVGITHSVPEMNGVIIRTREGSIFHTGDWKFDNDPVVGDVTDFARLKQLGKENILAAICDSTNVFSEGWSGSEGEIEPSLHALVKKEKGRVIVTSFASNIARLQTIYNVAKRNKRKVIIAGRSIARMIEVARENGYLVDCEFLDQKAALTVPYPESLILCTGCQGEENAALTRIANGDHAHIGVTRDDLVIFSSKIIPGNERSIFQTFNKLALLGARIITEKEHKVHVSGHPYRGELKKMYSIVKPKYAIPVHGEARHIIEHCEFAVSCGVQKYSRARNGVCFEFKGDEVYEVGDVKSGYTLLDGSLYHKPDSGVIENRKIMKDGGVLTAVCVLNSKGNFCFQPEILFDGFICQSHTDIRKKMTTQIRADIESCGDLTNDKVLESLRKRLTKYCIKMTDKRPFVAIVVKKI